MTEEKRIPLSDNLQFSWFNQAMETLDKHRDILTPYDRSLFQDLLDGFNLAGREMGVTRKQMNHIKQVAAEIETGKY